MNDQEKINRGEEAKRLLENEILQDALLSLDGAYISAWRNAKTLEAREDLYRYVIITKQFRSDLEAVLKDGQFAVDRLKKLEGQKGGLRKILG